MRRIIAANYYLQVVKNGEAPQWPRPEEELVVGSQELDSGFTQYWAYPESSNEDAQELPLAEKVASENPVSHSVIIITDVGEHTAHNLEIILAKNGHAWAKTESSLENLEDNISSIIEFAGSKFNMKVEHFMTTEGVPPEVERKLDELEQSGDQGTFVEEEEKPASEIRTANASFDGPSIPTSQPQPASSRSSIWLIIPLLVIIAAFVGVTLNKDRILDKLKGAQKPATQETTPTPTPAPDLTPTPTIDRSQYKIRVLNGTTKTGAAGALGDKLKEAGWAILSTGNATNSAFTQTKVRAKDASSAALETLISDLAADYEATSSANLTDKDKADLEVIIGKK